jgi:hypothetical protein
MATEALDTLGGDHDLDTDIPHSLGQVDRAVHARGEGAELVQDQQGVLTLAGFAAGGVVAVVLQHHPHRRIRLGLGQQRRHREDGQIHILMLQWPRSKAPARAAKKSAYRSRAPGRWSAMASMSLRWRGRPSHRTASSSTSRRRNSSSEPSTGGMSGAVNARRRPAEATRW